MYACMHASMCVAPEERCNARFYGRLCMYVCRYVQTSVYVQGYVNICIYVAVVYMYRFCKNSSKFYYSIEITQDSCDFSNDNVVA
jgi:hypothetical protein